ncbi:hypothetical protein LTR85_007371 [Meristemomyces frigidus]|nr:hypothetical protein LTR85_007371 [Meristemomyces frigidus]
MSSIEDLPEELVEGIVTQQDLADIRSLRRCSSTLAAKATQTHFKSYFTTKTVLLSATTLEDFGAITRQGGLGCLVQQLIISGVVDDSSKQASTTVRTRSSSSRSRAQDEELLTAALKSIADTYRNSARCLQSLKLRVLDVRRKYATRAPERLGRATDAREWRPIWNSCLRTWKAVQSALQTSQIPVRDLDLFNDFASQRCSLPYSALSTLDMGRLTHPFSALRRLSLSFSERSSSSTKQDSNFDGLSQLMQLSPHLEELVLHQFEKSAASDVTTARHLLIQKAAALPAHLRLRRVELHGLYIEGEDLRKFVQKMAPRELSLTYVRLHRGTFASLFEYCASDAAALESLHFDEIFEARLKVYFEGAEQSCRWPPMNGDGTDVLKREGDQVRQAIRYRVVRQGFLQGSPYVNDYWKERRHRYGPM